VATDPYRYFRVEARELIEGLGQGILELERGDLAAGARLFRLAHTLKGAARVVKQLEIAELSHQVEETLSRARDAARSATPAEARQLFALVDRMSEKLRELDSDPTAEPARPVPGEASPQVRGAPVEDVFQTVRIEIEEMDAVLRAVTETGVQLVALKREVARLRQLALLSAALSNHLMLRSAGGRGLSDAKEQGLAEDLQSGLERATQAFEGGLERVDQELADVREGADRLRLLPTHTLFPWLTRAVRDAAQALGKRAELEVTGGALRLDAHVLGPLRDALLHLVRNAVAHGIESPAERAAAGKPESGKVTLNVERRGERVVFTCQDDGKGIDVKAVRRELATRGLLVPTELAKLGDEAVLAYLLRSRVTTTTSVTQISGRGVGLDVVRETAERLQGEVTIRTRLGSGTSIELAVPVSLAALRALLVEVGTTTAAIPLDAIRETLRIPAGGIGSTPEGDSVVLGGNVIPFLPLGRALRQPGAFNRRAACSAVVVAAGERMAAVGVDRLLGTFEVVVHPLPVSVAADAVVGGAALDLEGNPRLVLNALGLLAAATTDSHATPEPAAGARLPLLVIDDSLTTRMLEQSILESAGYEVDLAVSAEQGLEKARERRYGLFIVDVEMPGMDGFEFVGRTRADSELGRIPAILVTSRSSEEDLARGQRAGASAYIVKGEFDQNLLLSTIRKLVG
jgi:two-component system, chemotaxis family, sensor kinase CheA